MYTTNIATSQSIDAPASAPTLSQVVSGYLLINKPVGITSHDVVNRLRRITGVKRIGHAGTLDPFATGLLIVGVGRDATKHLDHFLKLPKTYQAMVCLGATSSTGDRTGIIKNDLHSDPASREKRDEQGEESIKMVLKKFLGPQEQIPPMYSAKKVGGKRLYKLARAGKTIERVASVIDITELTLLEYAWPILSIHIACSSGTYIRTLAEDIGTALHVGAYCQELKRTAIGSFPLSRATNLDELTTTNWADCLQPLDLLQQI